MELTLEFPFNLKDINNFAKITVAYEQRRNVVSLSIPYSLKLVTKSNIEAQLIKKDADGTYLYYIEFPKTSECLQFIQNPVLACMEWENTKTVHEIESEANKLMQEYEENERRKKFK